MSAAIGKTSGNKSVGSPAVSPRRKSEQLGVNARKVVSKRYSLKDAKGRPLEEWSDIVRRVVGPFPWLKRAKNATSSSPP